MSYCITRGANIGITTLSDVRKKISRISIPSGVASQSSEQRAFFGLGNLFHFFFLMKREGRGLLIFLLEIKVTK
jgi:hypothetical protein